MKDLDFDELDKAVNSLMAGVKDTPGPQTDEKTHTVPSSPANTSTPSLPAEKPSATQLPVSRRPGRFMDVVHPSALARKTETAPVASRQGVTVEPESNTLKAPTAPSTPEPLLSDQPEKVNSSSPVQAPSLPKNEVHKETSDWPDPLDLIDSKEPVKKVAKEDTNPKPEEPPKPHDETLPPLTSPFLPDTKVEKRPLGANIASGDTDLPQVIHEDDIASQLPAIPEDVEPILPEELHGDVMAIESDTTQKHETHEAVSSDPAIDDMPKHTLSSSVQAKDEPPKLTGPISIAQQYREEPSSGPKENGAIYDTDTYHQPLSHPTKQKSGWMWIVWIILILVGGAGIGAALYFLGVV